MLLGWDSDPGIGRDQPVQFGILGVLFASFVLPIKASKGEFFLFVSRRKPGLRALDPLKVMLSIRIW
jgi:hypothetical protein